MPGVDESQHDIQIRELKEALRLGLAVVTELWAFSIRDWVTCVHAADIDGDGDIEVLFGSRNYRLFILTKLGDLKREFVLQSEWVGTVVGIDNTQATDDVCIIVGTRNNAVCAFDETLHPLWQYDADLVIRQVVVCDIDGDGNMAVIVASEDRCIHVLSCEDGELLWKYATNAWVRCIYAADIDGDGNIEILAGSGDNYLYVLDNHGHLKWRYNAEGKIYSLFATDLNNDGLQEILIGSDAKDIQVIVPDPQGGRAVEEKMWHIKLDNRVLSLFVIDVNKDGRPEILAGSEDKHLYIFDDHGNVLWKYYLGARIYSIYVIDVNRDGLLEVLVGADDSSIHVLRVELNGGERERILHYYSLLGRPPFSEINLSPTESVLLQALTDDATSNKVNYTLQQLEAASLAGDTLQALALLLELRRQRAQLQWCLDVGYIRGLSLSDVLNNSKLEIVVGTTQKSISVLDVDGTECWQYQLGDRVRALRVGDIDNDGEVEVVAVAAGGQVVALSRTGDAIKGSYEPQDWITNISIASSDNPETVELVMGSEEKHIFIYNSAFSQAVEPILAPQGIYTILASDINRDGVAEIIAGAVDDNVYIYTREGTLLWTYKTRDRIRALAAADIDGDGHQEIIIGSEDRTVHVVDDQGYLKWRYYTPHRVLDVYVVDVNRDGQMEIFLGCGDGCMYVLSAEGEYLWHYEVNDRVRAVCVADIDRDGVDEVVIGSEDRLYLLKLFNLQLLEQQIVSHWETLQQKQPIGELLLTFFQHATPSFRAFALEVLSQQPHLLRAYPTILYRLINDPSPLVRYTIARAMPAFYQEYPELAHRFFDALVSDSERDVRLAFVSGLRELVAINQELGFAYLDRFTKSIDMWVRRAVVRELYDLAKDFPQQAFRLLMITARDDRRWVRQESARSLAHYFDLHIDNLIEGSRSLVAKETDLNVHRLIAHRATKPVVRNVFRVIVDLFSELNETNVQIRLRDAVEAFENAEGIKYGPEISRFYRELYYLSCMRNIDEIAQYKYTLDEVSSALWVHFEETLQTLRQLTVVSDALNAYLRRDGLGDRLASLYEAKKMIDSFYNEVKEKVLSPDQEDAQQLSDITIFRFVLRHWRAIISSELSRLIGQAELRLEVQMRSLEFEEVVGFWLTVYNDGNSPADTVTVRLRPEDDFAIVGSADISIELVPSRDFVQIEFVIRPFTHKPHLTFEVFYNDAAAKGKTYVLGDRLDLHSTEHEYSFITNPYSVGMPIRDSEMFYGRQDDLAVLQADLTNPEGNVTIVLYGQRRSGKTSLLNQLMNTDILAPHIPIYVDMQNESLGISISKFLRNIAHYIQKALKKRGISVQHPGLKEFEDDPAFIFNCFLDEVEGYLQDRKLLLLIDEFEIMEQKVQEKALPQEIFEYLRSLMQHRESMNFVFSGTHTIMQLTANYWSVFFNIARHYKLSKLGGEAATQLITRPVEGMLEYNTFAMQKIRQLAADQPYLIQLICRALVDHCNMLQKNYVTINDVNIVLDAVMETGKVHFQWIWEQANQQERVVLSILAQEGGEARRLLSLADIEEVYVSHGIPYDHRIVLQSLSSLREKDIIESNSNNTRFRVLLGLSQRWLRETKSLRRVMLEENLLEKH
jgi:outer membrane protein assembly factor BamB